MASSAISALLLVSYREAYYNKSSAVAKMGDRLATIDGPKSGERAAVPLSVGKLGPHLTQCCLGPGLAAC